MVGGQDPPQSLRQYKQFVMSGITDDMSGTWWNNIKWQMLKGGDDFADRIYETFIDHRKTSSLSSVAFRPRRTITIDEIAHHVARICDVEKNELYRRRSSSSTARSLFMELCREHMNAWMSLTEMGHELGKVSVAALSHNSRRLRDRLAEDEVLRRLYEEVKKELAEHQSTVND